MSGGPGEDFAAAVLRLDAERYAAFLASDVDRLTELLDERLAYGHSNASRDSKAELLAKIGSGSLHYSRLDHELLEVVAANEHTVLLRSTMNASAVSAGNALELDSVTLSVWSRDPGGPWRLLAFQPTPRPRG